MTKGRLKIITEASVGKYCYWVEICMATLIKKIRLSHMVRYAGAVRHK